MKQNQLENSLCYFSLQTFAKSFSFQLLNPLDPKIFIYGDPKTLSHKLFQIFSSLDKNSSPLHFDFNQTNSRLILRTKRAILFSIKIAHSIISEESPLILLDDDPLIRFYWNIKAKESKLPLLSFSDPQKLLKFYSKQYIKSLYFLDEHLADEPLLPGHRVKKILTRKGVNTQNIHMISSLYSQSPFPKACPWENSYFAETSLKIK